MNRLELLAAIEGFDIDAGDPAARATLDACLRTMDEIERMQLELDTADALSVVGDRGVIKAHPLLDQANRHRAALLKMLNQLFGPDQTPAQARARHAAQARWSR